MVISNLRRCKEEKNEALIERKIGLKRRSAVGSDPRRRSSWAFARPTEASRLWSLSCSLHNLSSPSAIKQFYKSHLATIPHVYFGLALSLTVYIYRARNATVSRRKYPSSIDSHTHIMSNSSPAPRFGTPGGSSSSALLLGRQFKQMQSDKDIPGISCGLVNNSVFEWEVMLMLPDESGGLYGGGCFRSLLHFPSEYPHMPPKMKFVTPIWHPNSESCFPFYLFGLLLTVIFQSTRAAKSASPSCILQKKTSTATNPPPSAGPPSRPPRPSCSPSSACSHHPTTNHPQTSRPASNGARTRLLLKRRSESASETLRKVLGISLCPTIDNQAAYTVSLALNGFLFLFILKVHWRGSCCFLFYLHQYTYRTSGLICSATRDFTM
jgi:hypothetical protein